AVTPLHEQAPPGRKGAGLELSPFAGAADAALHAPQEQAPGAWAHAARTSSFQEPSGRRVRVARCGPCTAGCRDRAAAIVATPFATVGLLSTRTACSPKRSRSSGWRSRSNLSRIATALLYAAGSVAHLRGPRRKMP